jgi:hypothetical protein
MTVAVVAMANPMATARTNSVFMANLSWLITPLFVRWLPREECDRDHIPSLFLRLMHSWEGLEGEHSRMRICVMQVTSLKNEFG